MLHNRLFIKTPCRWLAAMLPLILSSPLSPAALMPYTPDADTLHLWHLDEAATPCLDSPAGGTNLIALGNGATLNNVSFTGFGTALNTVDGGQAGGATTTAVDAYLA